LLARDGGNQILLMSSQGVTAVAAADGKPLWKYEWRTSERIVQPAVLADGDLIISGGDNSGIRRVALKPGQDGWTLEQRWESNALKPYFNDFVIHDGHAYGFDGAILACVDLADGKRKWKGGRYGHGQMVLLRDQSLLLVLSEEGEIALVKADPGQFTELARMRAIEGKTWNHPALAGDRLYVRNGEQMAAFRLPRL
jgi:hypothetical protein